MVSTRSKSRGQAAVELALGIIVFIAILLFGIHFAEIGYLSVKVTEANASALWHATAAKNHTLPGNFSDVNNLISSNRPGQVATGIYSDFDSRSSGGSGATQLLTRGQGLQVTCSAGGPSFAPVATTDAVFSDTGGMLCRSEATLQVLPLFPRSFLDSGQGSFFKEQLYRGNNLSICGVNRARGGCQGQFGILLDDWALATGDEVRECKVQDGAGCDNGPFYQSVQQVYNQHVTVNGASLALARATVTRAPDFDPATFYHSFRVFVDQVPRGEGDTDWETTPGPGSPTREYDTSYNTARKECWLGLRCPQ
ncbi:MAG TPA: TadE family protein [Myxococcaceae bacterium]|jgi:hypothetical protein